MKNVGEEVGEHIGNAAGKIKEAGDAAAAEKK